MTSTDQSAISKRAEIIAFPIVISITVGINQTFFVNLLVGFHIWIHEFGHATVAWLSGYRALPLPIGWANIEETKSNFVYFGIIFLLGVLFYTGWNERKPWAMILAVMIAPLQAYMTWFWPHHEYELWSYWGGIGGEYILSALMIIAYFMDFPEKFKWQYCKYLFLFLGTSTFAETFTFWQNAQSAADIPWGTMLHGHEDEGGDMNYLRAAGWSAADIISSYQNTGKICLAVMILSFAIASTIQLWREIAQVGRSFTNGRRRET
ncbi:MAG: hypothetical protein AAF065_01980 [Verrucomicrobiota bacterium]